MPMSSLKTLIKFMFKSHEVNFEKIANLFQKSSVDARVCILEHFYYRAAEEITLKPMFLKLLQSVCEKNPDVFLLFFGEVYKLEDHEKLNQEVLNTVKAIIETEKMSIYMLNFAGYLKLTYNVPYQRAIAGFENISLQNKECNYVMVYMLRNYPQ